ncbi:MAG: PSD1 and planctomycete cytochrome C domain-containing protein [Planctomycetota bacterium]
MLTAVPAALFALSAPLQDPARDEALEHFEARVRPILVEHCVECHTGEDAKSGLRLDSVEGIAEGVDGDAIFVPGDPDASTIVEAVRYEDAFLAMPPSGRLPDEDIAAIARWVELGAHLPESIEIAEEDTLRWCFRPPEIAPVPDVGEEVRDAVDAHLFAALAERGVEPSAPADRRAWLRRVTFDLTGLPPTPVEMRAFLADASPDAYERVVDRLLASPAYGERWARRWLDLVRYAETKAHEFDYPIPNAFRYRDYVIRAFDADVPYDRFVIELLAGDLVETPRLDPTGTFDESVLGTGAWQLGEEVHSPVEPRADQTDRIAHQVEVLSKSVLALGVACARCHDHKFDPISAEDYHGLAGFALSTAPRQVRYESNDRNLSVARDLAALHERSQGLVREALAGALESEAEGLASRLLAARDLHARTGTRVRATEESLAALDALAVEAGGPRPDVLVEDFEGETLDDCGLAPWTVTGDAFLARPIRSEDVPENQGGLVPRGLGCINSYAGHPEAEGYSADAFTGTLTSAPFPIVRRHLHFLVDGGDEDSVRVELVDAESGAVLASTSGDRSNELTHARFDLEDFEGRSAHVRFVDEHEGGWGQIGGDHFVLSDDPDPRALDRARSIGDWRAVFAPADERTDPGVVAWTLALVEADARRSVAPWLGWLAELEVSDEAPIESGVRELVDWGGLMGTDWIVNGPGFGCGPERAGDVVCDVDGSGGLRVATVLARDAAVQHPTWRDLVVVDSRTDRKSNVDWVQAGRTILSPTFEVEGGRLAHLVRGSGHVLVSIASHKLVNGPLHGDAVKDFETGGAWRWIVQDIPSSAGLVAHVELTADGACEIARTVELAEGATLIDPEALDWAPDLFLDESDLDAGDAAARASFVERRVRDAAALLRDGGIAGRALTDAERATLYGIAEFVASSIPHVRDEIASALLTVAAELAAIEGRRVLASRLAPAAIDLEGRDERVLDRGSWRSPQDAAPRRVPSALRASDAPLAETGAGSGRLALAHALLASESAIVPRVWVNRVWHALFGRGIVATTDDFGAMGAKPTDQGLLDRLAFEFVERGWSTKDLVRRLVLTDAYRRSTTPTASASELDPTNELLGHMRVRRLEAEEVRDALLAVSGELDRTLYGPPVPIHLTPFMTGRGRPDASGPLDGDRRRSIYIEVRRNFPHPLLAVFDQPVPSTCHGRRTSANVPAQALALWNDPFVEGRAEALAAGVDASDPSAAIDAMWLRALGRSPRADELELALAYIGNDAESGGAAWVDLAHALFNTKEFLFLE